MNNKKQDKKPLFAEVNLTGEEFKISTMTKVVTGYDVSITGARPQ